MSSVIVKGGDGVGEGGRGEGVGGGGLWRGGRGRGTYDPQHFVIQHLDSLQRRFYNGLSTLSLSNVIFSMANLMPISLGEMRK